MVVPVLGFTGSLLLLAAYYLAAAGKIPAHGYTYLGINLAAGGLLLAYSLLITSWPFTFLNTVWVVIALGGLYKVGRLNRVGADEAE